MGRPGILGIAMLASACAAPGAGQEADVALQQDLRLEIGEVRPYGGEPFSGTFEVGSDEAGLFVRSTVVTLPELPARGRARILATAPLLDPAPTQSAGTSLALTLLHAPAPSQDPAALQLVTCPFPASLRRDDPGGPPTIAVEVGIDLERGCFEAADRCVPFAECGVPEPRPFLAAVVHGRTLGWTPYRVTLESPDFDGANDTRPVVQGGCSMREIRRSQQLCREACTEANGCARSRGIHECRPTTGGSDFRSVCAFACVPGLPGCGAGAIVEAPRRGTRLVCNDGSYSPTCDCTPPSSGCCSWHRGVRGCNDDD